MKKQNGTSSLDSNGQLAQTNEAGLEASYHIALQNC
jgi:hypothetical protein